MAASINLSPSLVADHGGRDGWHAVPTAPAAAAIVLAIVFAAAGVMAVSGLGPSPTTAVEVDLLLTTVAAAVLVPLALVFALRARHEPHYANLAMATGMLMLSAMTWGVAELTPLVAPEEAGRGLELLRSWSLVGALAAFGLGVCDTAAEWSCRRVMALPATAVLVALVAGLLPAAHGTPPDVLILVAWGAVFAAHLFVYLAKVEPRRAWITVALLGFLLADIGNVADVGSSGLWAAAAGAERILASLFALVGLTSLMEISQWRRNIELADSAALMADLQAMSAATRRAMEERDHEARSALAAIEYTAQALRRRATLKHADIEQLEATLTAEISLLRRLITMSDATAEIRPFGVAEALNGVIGAAAARGMTITANIPPELRATGIPEATSQIVQGLVENSRKHAPGSPVRIRCVERGPFVVTIVEDDGPGIAPERRQVVFRRGRDAGHPSSAGGRGLGLFIASRLAYEQGGELWVEESSTGGASFRLALPAADSAVSRMKPERRREEAAPAPSSAARAGRTRTQSSGT